MPVKQLFFLAVGSGLFACSPAAADSLSGIARAMDGDSLMVSEREVRLFGIDAPEFGQTCTKNGRPWACGEAAADQLSKLVTGQSVRCTAVDTDDYGRTVARCTAGAVDVNRAMVASGYATAYRRYSTAYVSAEESAKVNRRGLWSGEFEMPAEVRHAAEPPCRRLPATHAQRHVVSRLRNPPAAVSSRAIAVATVGSTACRGCPITIGRMPRRCSAPKPKRGLRDIGGRRCGSKVVTGGSVSQCFASLPLTP